MAKFNIAEATSNFSALVERAMVGEEVIIAKNNKPVVKLAPLATPGKSRKPGSAKGRSGSRRILMQLRAISGTI